MRWLPSFVHPCADVHFLAFIVWHPCFGIHFTTCMSLLYTIYHILCPIWDIVRAEQKWGPQLPNVASSIYIGTWYLGFRNRACTRQEKNASKHHQRRSSLCSVCWPPYSCVASMFGIHLLGIIYIYIVIWDIVRAFRSGVPIPNGVPNPRYLVPRIQNSSYKMIFPHSWGALPPRPPNIAGGRCPPDPPPGGLRPLDPA